MQSETDIIEHLDAPVKSFRLFALEEAIRHPTSEPLLKSLLSRFSHEDDEECKLLLSYAIEKQKGKGQYQVSQTISVNDFRSKFFSFDPMQKIQSLESIKLSNLQDYASFAPYLLRGESHPAVGAIIIRTFGKVWPQEHLQLLVSKLTDEALGVRVAALEALTERSPQDLVAQLPRLLVADDPRLRALAVKGLFGINAAEAVAHLENMLLEGTQAERFAGLQCAMLFPFRMVRDSLLKFLAAEKDPHLIERAGLHFKINPDLEVPYRLWEIVETVDSKKALLIKKFILGSCKALTASGLLKEDFPRYSKRLKEWINWRAATRFVQDCIAMLNNLTEVEESEIRARIIKNLDTPHVKAAFEAALSWPINPQIKEKFSSLLNPLPVAPIDSEKKSDDGASFTSLSDEGRIKRMAIWEQPISQENLGFLESTIQAAQSSEMLKAACFRVALRLELDGFVSCAEVCLKGEDAGLISSALEYIAHFDFEKILPLMGRFLKHPNPRVKITSLKVLKKQDTSQAVSTLLAMVEKSEPRLREAVLNCLVYFDFSLLGERLAKIFAMPSFQDILPQGLCLFEANPDPENLFLLYCLEKKLPAVKASLVREARIRIENFLIKSGRLAEDDRSCREKEFLIRWENEKKRQAVPPPPYSIEAIKKNSLSEIVQDFGKTVYHLRWLGVGLFGILLLVVLFSYYDTSPSGAIPNEIGRSLFCEAIKIRGTVENIISKEGNWHFKSDETFFLLPLKDVPKLSLRQGKKLELVVVPSTRTPEGVIYARVIEAKEDPGPEK